MNLATTYTRADVIAWLGQREVVKGQGYLGNVQRLMVSNNYIEAQVRGSLRTPYKVEIELFARPNGKTAIETYCSCPVAHGCKHAAAALLAALDARSRGSAVNPQVLEWLSALRQAAAPATKKSAKAAEGLFYVLARRYPHEAFRIYILKGRGDADGRPQRVEIWNNVERALLDPPRFVNEEDLGILHLLWSRKNRESLYHQAFPLPVEKSADALTRLLDSGRFWYAGFAAGWSPHEPGNGLQLLVGGEPRPATMAWQPNELEGATVTVKVDPPADMVLLLDELWYVSADGQLGQVVMPWPAGLVRQVLTLPPLSAADVPVVADALREVAPQLPLPQAAAELRVIDCVPQPMLELMSIEVRGITPFRGYGWGTRVWDCVHPRFRYGELFVEANGKDEYVATAEGETVRIKRRFSEEQALLASLKKYDLEAPPAHALGYLREARKPLLGLDSEAEWPAFMSYAVPALREAGWEVVVPGDFRHQLVEVDEWQADLSEDGSGWFSLALDIVVEGRKVALAPLLGELFRRDPRWLDAADLAAIGDAEVLALALPDGRRVRVEAGRIKPLARTLIDLFDGFREGPLRVSRFDAPRLEALTELPAWRFGGAEAVREAAEKLHRAGGVAAVAPPAGLGLELRPYQQDGVAWLQFLREHALGGILADDMGLGKTAQTLAHLLIEKEAGRLDRPALVVLPTSLIFNWQREAERFAPGLKVLSLRGKERAERFPLIAEHDVALTTYPLLWRDIEQLAAQPWHLLILDEAQTVKNATSQAAQAVRRLDARHRLCLTGTPLENHLGELWAQFDFLLPGFLGDAKDFARRWRNPVEKNANQLRRELLAARIKPFIMRRRKEDVAKELPPKTVIVRNVELEGGQRDLYETVRSAMDKRVREEIAARGFNRSQIVILDALLKLRQVCCDPRLLALPAAKKVKERAKLDLLMEMLPELVDEGRRILVFSQFTSMLALIEEELHRAKLDYVLLTGATEDRESVVRRFQDGEVPVFLISLKAGGVGLNLTAADTVIHYDPWWNPAVENQATDRAHRIGQEKNVFVYKLVAAGSIEEKILALQDKKAALAAGILSEDANGLAKFGEGDIAALLAPLPS